MCPELRTDDNLVLFIICYVCLAFLQRNITHAGYVNCTRAVFGDTNTLHIQLISELTIV